MKPYAAQACPRAASRSSSKGRRHEHWRGPKFPARRGPKARALAMAKGPSAGRPAGLNRWVEQKAPKPGGAERSEECTLNAAIYGLMASSVHSCRVRNCVLRCVYTINFVHEGRRFACKLLYWSVVYRVWPKCTLLCPINPVSLRWVCIWSCHFVYYTLVEYTLFSGASRIHSLFLHCPWV